jgi:polysaccharide pyruvyl transferase WcaK-like protein
MKLKRIVIVNDGLGPNKGDQAILLSMLDSLKQAIPDAQIMTFPNSKMHRVGQYLEFWRTLEHADLFIFGGGQEIQDHASVAFLISGLLKITLAKILSRPIFCYAIGVGPVATGLGKLFTRLVLNQVDLITVRDEDSLECLRQLRVTKPPCFVTADPTLALISSP